MVSACRGLGIVFGGRRTIRGRGKGEHTLLGVVERPLDGLREGCFGKMEPFCLLALDSGLTAKVDEVACPPLIRLSEVMKSRGRGMCGSEVSGPCSLSSDVTEPLYPSPPLPARLRAIASAYSGFRRTFLRDRPLELAADALSAGVGESE
jgi:hypothetical protein